MDAAQQTATSIIMLPSAMTIATVETLATQLNDLPANSQLVTLDASGTEIITTPGVQLLLSLHKTLTARGSALTVTNASDALAASFEQLGLKSQFSVWRA